jgi:hypothetical protein
MCFVVLLKAKSFCQLYKHLCVWCMEIISKNFECIKHGWHSLCLAMFNWLHDATSWKTPVIWNYGVIFGLSVSSSTAFTYDKADIFNDYTRTSI